MPDGEPDPSKYVVGGCHTIFKEFKKAAQEDNQPATSKKEEETKE